MNPAVTHPPTHLAAFQSSDYVRLIAAYLSVNDLFTVSTVSRSLHVAFDGEAVWQDRLKAAERIQHVDGEVAVPESAVLSSAQLAAVPPLPSVCEVAALCIQAYVDSEQNRSHNLSAARRGDANPPLPRLTAIVQLPATLLFHTRIIRMVRRLGKHTCVCIEFALEYSEVEGRWTVASMGDQFSGTAALNIDDNVVREEKRDEKLPTSRISPTNHSSRQRYIERMQCSEHFHNHCHRLLLPTLPLLPRRDYASRPAICPLPLCSHCRTVLAHFIAHEHNRRNTQYGSNFHVKVFNLTRINATLYETTMGMTRGSGHMYRQIVTSEHTGSAEDRAEEERSDREGGGAGSGAEGYKLAVDFGTNSAVYQDTCNVCERCQGGVTARDVMYHGMGHAQCFEGGRGRGWT